MKKITSVFVTIFMIISFIPTLGYAEKGDILDVPIVIDGEPYIDNDLSDINQGNCHEMSEAWFGESPNADSDYPFEHIISCYFEIRKNDFIEDESTIDENLFSENLLMDIQKRHSLVREMQYNYNFSFIDADVTYTIKNAVYNDDKIILTVSEWTFYDYDDLSNAEYSVDTSGFGTEHEMIIVHENNNYILHTDKYDESDISGMISGRDESDTDDPSVLENQTSPIDGANFDEGISLMAISGYSADKAVSYADKYYKNYNTNYSNYNSIGGDCANFVSQCLHAGGVAMNSSWYWKSYGSRSSSWSYCPDQRTYFAKKGTLIDNATAKNISKGNPVWYYSSKKGRYSHAAICVGKNSAGTPIVDAHNNDRYHVAWTLGGSAYGWSKYSTVLLSSSEPKPSKPSKPTISSAVANSTSSITVSWKAPSGGATSYKVGIKKSGEDEYKDYTTSNTSYTFKNLTTAKKYYFRLYAVNSAGTSPRSDTYSCYTLPKTPGKPTATALGTNEIEIKWSKVSGATKYIVYQSVPGGSYTKIKETDKLSYKTTKGINQASKYYYKISAVIAKGNNGKGDIETAKSENDYAYTPFARPKVNPGESTIKIPLPKASVPINTTDTYHYVVERKAKGDSAYKTIFTGKNTSAQTVTDSAVSKDNVYSYIIRIIRSDNHKILSSDAFEVGPAMNAPTLKSTDSNKITVSWKMSTPTTLKYDVYRQEGNAKAKLLKTVTTTSYVDATAQAGKTYSYYIEAKDSKGNLVTKSASSSTTHQILPTSIKINEVEPKVLTGGNIKLTANIEPSNSTNKNVTWNSENTSIATVAADGTVTGVMAGTVKITASTSNGITTSIDVAVEQNQETCNHQYEDDWNIKLPATCTSNGTQTRECTICHHIDEETIPMTGHQYGDEFEIETEPTCTSEGIMHLKCTVCGALGEAESISALGHVYEDEWTVTRPATCQDEGEQSRSCTVCGATETQAIGLGEHEYEVTDETETTPDGPGHRTYTCKVCQDSYIEEFVPEIVEGIVEVGSSSQRAGGEVTIPVSIKENPGIAGFTFSVNYDKNVLTPTEITAGDIIKSGTFTSNLEQGIPAEQLEQIAVHWNDVNNMNDNGVLFNITFDVNSNAAEGNYPVWLDYERGDVTDEAFDDVMPNLHDNVVIVSDVLRGDVNQDRVVDSRDGILLSQYLAKWNITFSENQLKAANVFNDSKVNSKDGVRLAQLLAGYEDESEPATVQLLSANDTANIKINSVNGSVGDVVYVPVTIEDNPGIAGFNFTINYDGEKLNPIGVDAGDVLDGIPLVSSIDEAADNKSNNYISVSLNSSENLTENGELFVIGFEIKPTVALGENINLNMSYEPDDLCNQNLIGIDAIITQGSVSVEGAIEDKSEIYQYNVSSMHMQMADGSECEELPINGDFDVLLDIENETSTYPEATIMAATYDINGKLIALTKQNLTQGSLNYKIHIDHSETEIDLLKIFIWNSLNDMKPMAEPIVAINQIG